MKTLRSTFALFLLSTVLLTACSLSTTSATKSITSATASSFSATPPSDQGTPAITVHPIILAPPILVAHSGSAAQQSSFGSYYWMITNGLADKASARGIEIQKDPLQVAKSGALTFTWTQQNSQSDSTLKDLKLEVYPKDSSIATVVTGQGTMTGFMAMGQPVATATLDMKNPSWTVNVDSGDYFVRVLADWSNPIVPAKPRNCEYGFHVTVS